MPHSYLAEYGGVNSEEKSKLGFGQVPVNYRYSGPHARFSIYADDILN